MPTRSQGQGDRRRSANAASPSIARIPIFDFGEVRVREAERPTCRPSTACREGGQCALGGARRLSLYRSAYDIARHYQREVLPLRKIISDETLLRYNAMQIDVFALLTKRGSASPPHQPPIGASAISGWRAPISRRRWPAAERTQRSNRRMSAVRRAARRRGRPLTR